jgi:hypothetical protein
MTIKRRIILDRVEPGEDPIYFDQATPASVCYAPAEPEDAWWSMKRTWLTPEDYYAFGEPDQITVTLEPVYPAAEETNSSES